MLSTAHYILGRICAALLDFPCQLFLYVGIKIDKKYNHLVFISNISLALYMIVNLLI